MIDTKRRGITARIAKARRLFSEDSLFRNAVFLMASTAVMSVLGFVFWIFVAHLYKPADIGVASALIAITTLLSSFSLLGLNAGLVRFLAGSKDQSRDINAAALVVGAVALLAAAGYALVGSHIGGGSELLEGAWHKVAFILLMVVVGLNSLTDAVFIANRRGEYHTIGYATFGVFKLLLPLVFIPLGALGIFGAYGLAMLASLIISCYLMVRGCGYRLFARPAWELLRSMRQYTTHNYLGAVVAGISPQLMPTLIIHRLGAADAAFFSMAWTMVNLLYIIPSATTQSMLAESSHDTHKKAEHRRRTVRFLVLLLTPAVIGAIIISPRLLAIFGPAYSAHGAPVFQLLAFATFFVAITSVGNTLLNIERRAGGVFAVQLTTTVVTGGAALFLVRFGLPGIGWAFLIGDIAACLALGILWLQHHGSPRENPPFPLEPADLRALLEPYGIRDASAVRRLGNGSNNCTLGVTSPSQRMVLRIYYQGSAADEDIEQEIAFVNYLAAKGLPVPRIIAGTTGSGLSHYAAGGVRWQYLAMEFAAGSHPEAYTIPLLRQMAVLQAQLHLLGSAYVQESGSHRRRLPVMLQIRQLIFGLFVPSGFSHFDYDATNILADQGRVVSILDFESIRYGQLVNCLAFTLSRIYQQSHNMQYLTGYLAVYQKTRLLTRPERLLLRLLLAMRHRKLGMLRLRIVCAPGAKGE